MKLSVIVPAYNEAATINKTLSKLAEVKEVYQIIVVDDASRDNTIKEVKRLNDKRIHICRHEKNLGKGAAIRTGLAAVSGDYVLIQDADLEYDPADIHLLTTPVINDRATVVFGSRFLGSRTNMFFWHFLGNQLLNFIVNILYNTILSDLETCYKLIPTALMKRMNLGEGDFRIEVEITCKLIRLKQPILEVPISYVGRSYEDGKKIGWQDWFKAVWAIIKYRWWKG